MVRAYVLDKFTDARSDYRQVTRSDLERWLAEGKHIFGPSHSLQSKGYMELLKKCLNIRFRRVTKKLSKSYRKDEETRIESAKKFNEKIDRLQEEHKIPDNNVWNSDQSRFEYEMASNQTYDFRGVKDVYASLVCQQSNIHSYTV